MNEENQVSNSFLSSGVPLKRKRGRPRKDRTLITAKSPYIRKRDQLQNHGENAHIPPGFERVNGNQPHPVALANSNTEDSMIGQRVTGVIEASFDAGFLISVRVSESDTSLRGVILKPGHYVPVSSENDLAPNSQMIQRTEFPIPGSTGQKRQGRVPSYSPNGSPSSNQLARVRARQQPIVVAQSPHPVGARGTVVPVVLQPVNLSNGSTPAIEAHPVASQPAHLAASQHKNSPSTQPIQDVVFKGSLTDDGGSASQPFKELVSVAKRMQGSPESSEVRNESGIPSTNVMPPNDSGLKPEQAKDMSKPLLVKPLQAIRSGLPSQSTFMKGRTGKMTELLLAVQEKMMERQITESQHQEFRSPQN